MQMTEYLQILTQQIRCQKAHPMIEEEYKAHIEDQAETYMECGMEKEEAIEAAVAQMGDPVEAGVALDGIHRPKMCKSMLVMITILTLIGIISQAVIFKEVENTAVQENYLIYTIIYNLIGFGVMFAVCYLDYSFFAKHILWLYAGWTILMLFLLMEIEVGFITGYYQRRLLGYHLLSLFGPIYAGILFRYRNEGLKGLIKAVLFLLPPVIFSLQNSQMSACLQLYMVALLLFTASFLKGFFGKYKKMKLIFMWSMALVIPVIAVVAVLNGYAQDYRAIRLRAYFNPAAYEKGAGFIATNVGKVLGGLKAFGGSIQVLEGNLLPNTYDDFILLSIFHYFGIVIGIVVCGILILFFIKAFRVSFTQKNQLARLIGIACTTELFMRAFIYALANFGLTPFTQMNMPFLSFGLMGTVSNSMLTGLILSVYRYENVLSEKQMNTGPRYKIKIEKVDVS